MSHFAPGPNDAVPVVDAVPDPGVRRAVVAYNPRARARIEAKSIAAAAAALLVGVGVTVANLALGDAALLGGLPPWAQSVVTLLGPPLVTYGAAWQAKHTARPDLPPDQR